MQTVQFQTILYENDPDALFTSAQSIAVATRFACEHGFPVKVTLSWGDSSHAPLFSDAQIKDMQEKLAPTLHLQYTFFAQNTGTSLGHNRLAAKADAQFFVLMNPDILVSANFLSSILEDFHNEQVGMVEARQMPLEHPKRYDTTTREVTWTTGACSMVRARCFHELGGYDAESFFMYFDDVDLSWRARLAGWKLLYNPLAAAYHAKEMDQNGKIGVTHADRVYSPEAIMILLYKYGWMDALQETMDGHRASPRQTDHEALERFLQRQKEGRLPKQIDPEHRVSCYIQKDPNENRFAPKMQ